MSDEAKRTAKEILDYFESLLGSKLITTPRSEDRAPPDGVVTPSMIKRHLDKQIEEYSKMHDFIPPRFEAWVELDPTVPGRIVWGFIDRATGRRVETQAELDKLLGQ